MYNKFYGFAEKPFSLTPDPHFFYLSSVHKRALAYLRYGLEDRKGFITITGEIGAGKTTLIRALIKELDPRTTVAHIINTRVSSLQLLKMIINDFGIEYPTDSKEVLLEELNTFLLQQYSMGYNTVIIIDEAQNLEATALEEIRLLSNLETEKDKLLQIILVGQPELRAILALPQLKQLRQRITVGYHISPLTKPETGEYIKHRLTVAGAEDANIFAPKAMEEIYLVSGGIPRLINILCDAALVTGYVEETRTIDEDLIQTVIDGLDLIKEDLSPPDQKKPVDVCQETNSLGKETLVKKALQQGSSPLAPSPPPSEVKKWAEEFSQREKELEIKKEELLQLLGELSELEKDLAKREELLKSKEKR